MGIFDKIKFKKDDKGKTVEKEEKAVVAEVKEKEVEKAAKVLEKTDKAPKAEQTPMRKDKVSAVRSVVLRPLITEKTAVLASSNKYVFVVNSNTNRVEVKSAIKAMYGITPEAVNIQNVNGKRVRFGRRRGKRKDWKKAIVTLPKGKTIDVYEGV